MIAIIKAILARFSLYRYPVKIVAVITDRTHLNLQDNNLQIITPPISNNGPNTSFIHINSWSEAEKVFGRNNNEN